MNDLAAIEHLIKEIWVEPLCAELLSKKVDVSNYSELSQEITDRFLVLEEVFRKMSWKIFGVT